MPWLEPGKHYVQVKFDFSDLEEKLIWAMDHEKEAKEIADASTDFIKNHLRTDDVNCYVYRLILDYAKVLNYVP